MDQTDALLLLLAKLKAKSYTFICPSPESQLRVIEGCKDRHADTLEDVFGWSLPVERGTLRSLLDDETLEQAHEVDIIEECKDRLIWPHVRVSNLYLPHLGDTSIQETLYYIHSAFPIKSDSVFFGPDTYLYLDYLKAARSRLIRTPRNIVDVCCGAGAGAIHLARQFRDARVFGLDLNKKALEFAAINASHASVSHIKFTESNLFAKLQDEVYGKIDIILSNPPYIATAATDEDEVATYADGGSKEGLELAMRIIDEGFELLAPGGLFILYTGVTIPLAQPSFDPFLHHLGGLNRTEILDYRILHPDMWPEEIGKGAYVSAARIQVVGTIVKKMW